MSRAFVVVDIETTGISPTACMITEIGALKIVNDEVVDRFSELINPQARVSEEITRITGLTNAMLDNQPTIEEIMPKFMAFNEGLPLLGHNVLFDYSFLKYHSQKLGFEFERKGMDTLKLAAYYLPDLKSKSLAALIDYFDINREMAHRAFHDAKATYEVYRFLKDQYMKAGESYLFEPTPLHWKAKKVSPITPKQIKFLKALIEKHQMFTDIDVESLTKSEASRHIDRILFTKGS